MTRTRAVGIGAAVLCIAASALTWQATTRARLPVDAAGAQIEAGSAVNASTVSSADAATPAASGFAMDASSLRGTETDGGVSLDANGNVVLDLRLRRLFDYYLSLIGERDRAQIRQLLDAYLLDRHGPQHAATVLAYFDRYAAYLQLLADAQLARSSDPQERLDRVSALRRQALGDAMAAAFFAEEEALAALTLKRMKIAADDRLSPERKSELLADLDLAAGFSARTEADTASDVADQNRSFELQRSTPQQRAAEREALWGKEAAQRLAELDASRARWDARIDAYLSARSRIDADRTLSAAARAQAVATLRAQHFDAIEQRRIASLEAVGQLKGGG